MTKNFFGGVNVKNVVNAIIANKEIGRRGTCVVAIISLDKKLDKAYKDMVGRLEKKVAWYDRPLVSYEGNVNAVADAKFKPNERKGFMWLNYPLLEKAIKSGVEYLTFSYRDKDKGEYEEAYYMDGVEVAKSVIDQYLKVEKHYTPHTQVAVGVTQEKDFSKVVRYEIERVVYIGSDKAKAKALFDE